MSVERKKIGFIVTIEIILLALVAAFLGLRLYSVLGKRTGHEQEHMPRKIEPRARDMQQPEDQHQESLRRDIWFSSPQMI